MYNVVEFIVPIICDHNQPATRSIKENSINIQAYQLSVCQSINTLNIHFPVYLLTRKGLVVYFA